MEPCRMSLCLILESGPIMTCFFFFNDTATTEIYTLSLHDALPILRFLAACGLCRPGLDRAVPNVPHWRLSALPHWGPRSEEHTSELQSHLNIVCRLLLGKKNRPVLHPRFCYCFLVVTAFRTG